jgi:hypothetical protein
VVPAMANYAYHCRGSLKIDLLYYLVSLQVPVVDVDVDVDVVVVVVVVV